LGKIVFNSSLLIFLVRLNFIEIFVDSNVRGTLAIIRKLNLEGKITIDNLDELYQQLMAMNFRVKRSLFDAIFED
jgi:Cu/Ag efflux protein CusF